MRVKRLQKGLKTRTYSMGLGTYKPYINHWHAICNTHARDIPEMDHLKENVADLACVPAHVHMHIHIIHYKRVSDVPEMEENLACVPKEED